MRKFLLVLMSFCVMLMASDDFTLLPRKTAQTTPFFEKYPAYNGKEVTIFIMDTGVEISLPGLNKNPDGTVKVVDVFDASRCGDIPWVTAEYREIDGVNYLTDNDEIFLRDFEEFDSKNEPFYLGIIQEKIFQNNVARDMNGNGKEDDAWGFITFKDEKGTWCVVLDTDMDGSLKGEKILHNYDINQEYIMLPRKNPLFNHQWMALAVKIYPDRKVTNFHFEDGAHGTHVAGIAAGYHLNGDSDVNGLAPGAKIVSIKIGDGKVHDTATVTGSKKRGLEYISNYMKKHGGLGVINISFGIESSNEGFSVADNIFNDFAVNNPNVVVCTSAGNEGPGLSSVGTPSAAQHIIASGALMYHTTGRDKYGWTLPSPKVLQFSSRGGETTKPDVVSPGAELSTVPRWETNDFYWGTSMASPYTAGEIAAVLSGLIAELPDAKISSALVHHGLRETATKLEGYTYLDQGNGMVNMLSLFEWLKKEAQKEAPLHYQISTDTFTPSLPLKKSNSVYWRISDIKDIPDEVEVNITPVFNDKVLQKDIDGFFAKYKVTSDSRWVKPLNKNITLLRKIGETVKLKLKTDDFEENEFRVAKISFIPDDNKQNIGQEIFVTVINPIRFDEKNDFTYKADNQTVSPGHQNRYFLALPHGSSSMNIKVQCREKEYAKLRIYLVDNHGLPAARIPSISSDREFFESTANISKLESGVYELIVLGDLSGKKESNFDVEVRFSGVKFCDKEKYKLTFTGGDAPSFSGKIYPVLDTYKNSSVEGEISGYARQELVSFGDNDTITHIFEKTTNDKAVAFNINMPLKYHTNFTDIMIIAENSDGVQVKSSSISAKNNHFYLDIPAGNYTLKILPAYADYAEKEKFDLELEEVHYFAEKYTGFDKFPEETMFQNESYSFSIKLSDIPPMIPTGFYYYGEVRAVKRDKTLTQKTVRAER